MTPKQKKETTKMTLGDEEEDAVADVTVKNGDFIELYYWLQGHWDCRSVAGRHTFLLIMKNGLGSGRGAG